VGHGADLDVEDDLSRNAFIVDVGTSSQNLIFALLESLSSVDPWFVLVDMMFHAARKRTFRRSPFIGGQGKVSLYIRTKITKSFHCPASQFEQSSSLIGSRPPHSEYVEIVRFLMHESHDAKVHDDKGHWAHGISGMRIRIGRVFRFFFTASLPRGSK
jgi:hypothetical protein